MSGDWFGVIGTLTPVAVALLTFARWVLTALRARDERMAAQDLKIAKLEVAAGAQQTALVAAEMRTAAAMDRLEANVKHMTERLDALFTLLAARDRTVKQS